MTEKIRWGVLGPGGISRKFATGLKVVEDAELLAVGSRTQASADRFGDEFGVPRRYASYEELANDPDVDAVYVATPHPYHKENTILCLNAGKAVLCEKPFAINAGEAREMIAVAKAKQRFLMEAMWTRYLPAMVKLRELIAQGAIGEVRMLQADFGFRTSVNPKGRLFDLALGGGALLDVGIYPLSLAAILLGEPEQIFSAAHLGETGADEQNAIILRYSGGRLALLSSAVRTKSPEEAVIMGTEGMIRVPGPFWRAERFTLRRDGKDAETYELPFKGNGYEYEAIEVGRCVRAGALESQTMSWNETVALMETMDTIRAQWGLVYPMESA